MPPVNLAEIVSRALSQPLRTNATVHRRGRPRVVHARHPLDHASRLLAQPRQPVIAIVVTDSEQLLAGDADWIALIDAITVTCQAQRGLCALHLLKRGASVPETLFTARFDAAIIIGQPVDETVRQIRSRRPTAVLIEPPAKNVAQTDRP